jgi:hypothetical protein
MIDWLIDWCLKTKFVLWYCIYEKKKYLKKFYYCIKSNSYENWMPFVKYGINLKDENDEYIKEQQVGMVQEPASRKCPKTSSKFYLKTYFTTCLKTVLSYSYKCFSQTS